MQTVAPSIVDGNFRHADTLTGDAIIIDLHFPVYVAEVVVSLSE